MFLVFFFYIFNVRGQNISDPTKWIYFTMYLNSIEITNNYDMIMFNKLRDDLALYEEPQWKRFQIVVDISSKNDAVDFIVVGDFNSRDVEYDREAMRFAWAQLSDDVQKWLVNWKGKNKILKKR